MGKRQTLPKDPNATLDFTMDWVDWLGTDEIQSSTWTVPEGLTSAAETYSTTAAVIWLTGGTAGTTYTVTNRIVTVGGRREDRSLYIKVDNR